MITRLGSPSDHPGGEPRTGFRLAMAEDWSSSGEFGVSQQIKEWSSQGSKEEVAVEREMP